MEAIPNHEELDNWFQYFLSQPKDIITEVSEDEEERKKYQKAQQRLLRNRGSAKLSRANRKDYEEGLKKKVETQAEYIETLLFQNRHLTAHNQKLMADNKILYHKCCDQNVHINVEDFRLCPAEMTTTRAMP
jgi:hypothetical protein